MNILIIEDEEDLALGLKRGLVKNGYSVTVALDGYTGQELIFQQEFDCVLLDLNLPELDGMTILKTVRLQKPFQKILILSARSEVQDKVDGLKLGADDYLTKPFHFEELLERIRNLCKRQFLRQDQLIQIGRITVDLMAKQARISQNKVDLTAREYQILEYLARNCEKISSAEQIISSVWGEEEDLFSNSFKVHLSSLRKKLISAGVEDPILCRRGLGYSLEDKNNVQKA